MAYRAYDLICRRCADLRVPDEELMTYLDRFVNELQADTKADEETFRHRMEKCAVCTERAGATCRLCGCYCQVRTAIKSNRCPKPGVPDWVEAT